MIRQLLHLGLGQEGDFLESLAREEKGRLYVLDCHPEEGVAYLVPHELDGEKCRRFLWVGDPPASNAPRDRATTSGLHYLLGQAVTQMAEDSLLQEVLRPLLCELGGPGDRVRFVLNLSALRLEGAQDAEVGPFRVQGGRLQADCEALRRLVKEGTGAEGPGGKRAKTLADLVEKLAETLLKAWGVEKPREGRLLFTLALNGKPLVDLPAYRQYLSQRLVGRYFKDAEPGCCHGCGTEGKVVGDFAGFRLKFYITDKKSFAPGLLEKAFPKAYGLCEDCFRALLVGENFVLNKLLLRFLESDALVLPEAELNREGLQRMVDVLLAEVRGLERVGAWKEFLERASLAWKEVGYLGFSLLFFRRTNAATKAEELVLEVPPSRVEALFRALGEAGDGGFPVEGLRDWLYLLPLSRREGRVEAGPALKVASRIFMGLPLAPRDILPLWLKAAERAYREDASFFGIDRYRGPQGALDLAALGAGWVWVLRRLGIWGGYMEGKPLPLGEEALREAYGFGPLEAGLYLLGQAMEAVGQAQAKLYEYKKEPLLEALGWQGMSLVRVRHLVPEVMAKASYYLSGNELAAVLDLLGRATDLLERGRSQGPLSEKEVPYYILMGYAQARSRRLRAGKKEEVQDGAA
ncbi:MULTISPECIES: TM1802 family CRISPR-associated protein [Thermus]|jgi:CRISPR-associated protein Csh1|uniref:TM1802 family CRISPR-associated protein n=1 Tax=Thermus TaxID=270 RepID=UPI0008FD6068|nr:TM1802 family CRISPR-associated protein [Thermus brockianus]